MKKIFTLLFFVLLGLNNINAATFSSIASGTWSAPATWTITSGTDGDGKPDNDDDVTINAGHVIALSAAETAKTLLNNGTIQGNANKLNMYGNFNNNGSVSGLSYLYFWTASTFSTSVVFNGATNWWVSKNLTISSGGAISLSGITINATVTNLGSFNVQGNFSMSSTGKWINSTASTLTLSAMSSTVGVLDASATGNTVIYKGTLIKKVINSTYYNLTLLGATSTTRTAQGNLTVLNDLTIGSASGHVFNLNNFNLTVGGNWINQSNSNVLNQGIVTFNTSSTQTISKTTSGNEVFKNMTLSGTGTTTLAKDITISQNLTINSGTFDVSASNYSVNVGGNITNNGTLNCRSGLITLNGISAQSISGSSSTQFYALTLNNASGATVNSAQSVTDVLTVTNGNFNSNGNVTLVSNSSKTARLGVVGATGSFSGNMIIQKYVPALVKNWHDLSSPVQGTTIYDWDDEMYMSGLGCDCPVGIAGTDGNAGSFKSVRTYNEPTATYANVTSSLTVLTPGKGYMVWLSDNMNNWNAKTFDARGVPNFTDKTINLSYTAGTYAGVNLIGNPFASAIDYSLVSKNNTDGHAYGYNNGVWTDYGTNAILTSHQGFWVYATSAGASITVPEASKSAVTATSFHRLAPNYDIKLIYQNSNVDYFNEATVNIVDNATEKWDIGTDAVYFNSPEAEASTLSFNTGDRKLLTNAVNDKQNEASLPIELFSPKTGLYYIQPSVLNIGEYKYVWIENTKTGEKFDLNKSVPVNIEKVGENNDFVLRLSKKQESSSVNQTLFANDLIIFNSENSLNLKSNKANHELSQISVFDISGKLVLEVKDINIEESSIYKMDISFLNQGVYIVNAIDVNGNSISKKIIK